MKTNKAIRFFIVVLFLCIQLTFLAIAVKESYDTNNFTTILSILVITLIILLGYKYLDLHHEEHLYEKISVVIWVPIGALACYLLNLYTDLGSIISAGIVGTLSSFIPSINKNSNYLQSLPPAIYCGVFVGMSSTEITPSITLVAVAGTLAGILFLLSKSLFVGIGGKLGTISFVGVLIVSFINWLFL